MLAGQEVRDRHSESKYGVISQFPVIDSPADPLNLNNFNSERSFEHFEVGYSKFGLKRYNITVELAASKRTGLHRYTFPPTKNNVKIIIDLPHNLHVLTYAGGWNQGGPYIVYFCSQFNVDAIEFATWTSDNPYYQGQIYFDGNTYFGKINGAILTFNATKNPVIKSRVGISFISADQACLNAESEIPDWNFEKTVQETVNAWQTELEKIYVEGATDDFKTIFYTVDIVRSLIDTYQNEGYMPDGRSGLENGITQGGSNGDMVVNLWNPNITFNGKYDELLFYVLNTLNLLDLMLLIKGAKGFMMPRYENGTYKIIDILGEDGVHYAFYEATPWEYSLDIPFDVKRLIELTGGPKLFEERLDKTFSNKTYLNGYYNIGNEPDFFHVCLYHFIGKQYKSVEIIRDILKTRFGSGQDGVPGNDDSGAMGSWFAFNAIGLYPLETHVNPYIQNVKLNTKNWKKTWFRHSDIANGAIMEFVMGPEPSKVWGVIGENDDKIDVEDRVVPPSMSSTNIDD
ncbi:13364_t:CDS:2 [Racocetra fulgida]|uniref:13364_t:CDS:1 n=1 Tax=Racocetra fulgida TaxID=60492 RepID=A0A9N8ZQN7_9GLOM|nr:13364_t:CDS:2 [Racocetra fulgida]